MGGGFGDTGGGGGFGGGGGGVFRGAPKLDKSVLDKASDAFDSIDGFLRDKEVPAIIAFLLAGLGALVVLMGGVLFSLLLTLIQFFALPFATGVATALSDVRKEGSPELNLLITSVMGEFFGADFDFTKLPIGGGAAGLRQRATAVGAQIHTLLRDEFLPAGKTELEPGSYGAETFTGFVVDFGVNTAVVSLLGEMASLGIFDHFRDLGVEVANNMGLGRLHRAALRPLIDIVVATPMEWGLNKQFRPKLLGEGDVFALLAAGLVEPATAFEELARQGFSTEKMNVLAELRQKRIGVGDVDRMIRWGIMPTEAGIEYIRRMGYDLPNANLILLNQELIDADAREASFAADLVAQYVNGAFDTGALRGALDTLHLSERVKDLTVKIAASRRETPHRFLTLAQAQRALLEGVVDLDEFNGELEREGYSFDDRQILRVLTFLQIARAADAQAEKDARAAAKEAAAAKKASETPPPTT